MKKILYAVGILTMLLTEAVSAQMIDNGCIGECDPPMDDDEFYGDVNNFLNGIKPNFFFRSKNMNAFNQLFARSKIMYSERRAKGEFIYHDYNLLIILAQGSSKATFYAVCELQFADFKLYSNFVNGKCSLWDGTDKLGIAKTFKELLGEEYF